MEVRDLLKRMDRNYIKSEFKIGADKFFKLWKSGEAVLLDIRTEEELEFISIKNSIKIPLNQLPERVNELPKDKIIAVFCPGRIRATVAYVYLVTEGYKARVLTATFDDFGKYLAP